MIASAADIRGLYAVTPDTGDSAWLSTRVEAILAGGARVVQYRNKTLGTQERLAQAHALRQLTRSRGVVLLVNDDVDLARQVDANGVHLGRDDATVRDARRVLGAERLIGVSCYDRIELAERALAEGADYVAFGSAFPSTTKPGAVHAPLTLYAEAKRRLRCPVVAIGGIRPDNAAALVRAGVDALAVISALFDAADPRAAAAALARWYSEPDQGRSG
jgi:thiamine-phosphate pyrophosphorylase